MSATPWQTYTIRSCVYVILHYFVATAKSAKLHLLSPSHLIATLINAGHFIYHNSFSCFLENMSVNISTFVDKHWHLLL